MVGLVYRKNCLAKNRDALPWRPSFHPSNEGEATHPIQMTHKQSFTTLCKTIRTNTIIRPLVIVISKLVSLCSKFSKCFTSLKIYYNLCLVRLIFLTLFYPTQKSCL
jgi:hypothetical protein